MNQLLLGRRIHGKAIDFGTLECGYTPVDLDTFAMDNGGTKKELVGRTYAGVAKRAQAATILTMKISQQCVVALTWTLKDTLGEELDVLDEPVEFLIGGSDLLPPIEEALQGHCAGATIDLHIEPEQAFGDFNDQLIFLELRALFPKELEAGQLIEGYALPPGCNPAAPKDALYAVTDVYPEHVVLDGNHPLAGIAIRISIQVASVREATEEEIGRGSTGSGFFRIQPVHATAAASDTLH